ncbi:hypothetical protein NEMIN01_0499 [Nematocida minor]|uniref:uncharacterized protein n=1 Tax=Nematocida minor TaxID=1912983 RepID=UPI00221E9BF3|nr:uncharacterized protein NEMIN01_0499 [Nematocida minor]KAI5189436.1 hypothetical protein NEMIN01_0499 [Nematocida minor]
MRRNQPEEVSSMEKKEKVKKDPIINDPRFFKKEVNPLYFSDTYGFLYEKEKEQLERKSKRNEDVKKQMARIEARNKIISTKRKEKEEREKEMERVKEGKTPFYLSHKQKKMIKTAYEAKEKGLEHVLNRIKKKKKEKENRSRRLLE